MLSQSCTACPDCWFCALGGSSMQLMLLLCALHKNASPAIPAFAASSNQNSVTVSSKQNSVTAYSYHSEQRQFKGGDMLLSNTVE
jgi:hypothetical protein